MSAAIFHRWPTRWRRQFRGRFPALPALLVVSACVLSACQQTRVAEPTPASQPPATAAPEAIPLPGLDSFGQQTPAAVTGRNLGVGFLVPLSGPSASIGQALLNAAQMALFDFAAASGAPDGAGEIVLLPRDTKGTPEGAVAAAQEALADGAQMLLGPLFSADVEAVAPLARARNVPVVAFTNDYAVAGNGVYILGFTPEMQVKRIVAYAASRGAARIAALVPDSVYGQRITAALRDVAGQVGAEVSNIAAYDPSATTSAVSPVVRSLVGYDSRRAALQAQRQALAGRNDEASQAALRRLERADAMGDVGFDAILIPESGSRLKVIAPLLPFYDLDTRHVRALGTIDWDTPDTWTEPSLVGAWYPAPSEVAREGFVQSYRQLYGAAPPPRASLGYDAAALAVVLGRGESPQPFSPEAITQPNGFAGVDGIVRLLPSGLPERGLAVKEIAPRSASVVSPAPTTFEQLTQ